MADRANISGRRKPTPRSGYDQGQTGSGERRSARSNRETDRDERQSRRARRGTSQPSRAPMFFVGALIVVALLVVIVLVVSQGRKSSSGGVVPIVSSSSSDSGSDSGSGSGVTLMMVGDVLVHEEVWESGEADDGTYNYDHLFANISSEISKADLAILNQETCLGGTEYGLAGYPSFNSPQEIGDAEVAAGFNCFACATNHTLDWGWSRLSAELDFWSTNYPDALVLGIADSEEDYDAIQVFEQDGITIALLNYTYGLNGVSLPDENPYAVTLLDEEKVLSDLEKAQEVADFVVVLPHWGTEYETEPTDEQREWAQIFADNGADLIIGTHPHCLEPVEVIEGADGQQVLCFWSLGNFVSAQTGVLKAVGGLAEVRIARDDQTGECYVSDWALVPVVCQQDEGTAYTTYLLSDYTDELASQGLSNLGSVQEIQDFCAEVLGEGYNEQFCALLGSEVR